MNIAERLVAKRRGLTSRKIIRQVMAWVLYIDLPWNVEIGEGFQLLHRGAGVIIHPATKIGKNVTIQGSGANVPWSGTVTLPAGSAIQYKYVKWNGSTATWESAHPTASGNREFTTPASCASVVTRSDGSFRF